MNAYQTFLIPETTDQVACGTTAIVLPGQEVSAKEKMSLGRKLAPILVSWKSLIQVKFTAGPQHCADSQKFLSDFLQYILIVLVKVIACNQRGFAFEGRFFFLPWGGERGILFPLRKIKPIYFKVWNCLLQEITRAIHIDRLIMIQQVFHGTLTSMLISLGKFCYKLLQHSKWKTNHCWKGLLCRVSS